MYYPFDLLHLLFNAALIRPHLLLLITLLVLQRLKELKQREFYRALACRRQRRRREKKREERVLRRLNQHEDRRTGEWLVASINSFFPFNPFIIFYVSKAQL